MDTRTFVVILSFCLFQYGSCACLEDAPEEKTTVVREGKDLLESCYNPYCESDQIFWIKNSSIEHFIVHDALLNLTAITRRQAGQYICELYNDTSNTNETLMILDVDVQYPAIALSFTITPDELTENETFIAEFELEGNPAPMWVLQNNYTKETLSDGQGSGKHTIGPLVANCTSRGPYVLLVVNEVILQFDTMARNLTVFCPPRPSDANTYVVGALIGMDAFFLMNSIGFPYPNFTWSRADGQPLKSEISTQNFQSFAMFNIHNVGISDFTEYRMKMNNSLGSYTTTYKLEARGAPQMPKNIAVSNITYHSAVVSWTSGFDMGTPQHFYIMRRFSYSSSFIQISESIPDTSSNHGVGQNWTHTQFNLDSDTDIELTVIAENGVARSQFESPGVIFHTLSRPGHKSSASYTNIGVILGGSIGALALVTAGTVILLLIIRTTRRRHFNKI